MRADLTPLFPAIRLGAATLATALALILAAPHPAQAQVPGTEDLRALIYYLDHDDQRSVQAEMRRLRAAFPNWTPPSDVNQLRAMGTTATATVLVASTPPGSPGQVPVVITTPGGCIATANYTYL